MLSSFLLQDLIKGNDIQNKDECHSFYVFSISAASYSNFFLCHNNVFAESRFIWMANVIQFCSRSNFRRKYNMSTFNGERNFSADHTKIDLFRESKFHHHHRLPLTNILFVINRKNGGQFFSLAPYKFSVKRKCFNPMKYIWTAYWIK